MKKISKFFERIFSLVPGYIFGYLTFVIGFTGDVLALVISGIVGDYYMWEYSISVLGHRAGGLYVRGGLIISNIIAIPFIIYLGMSVKGENVNESLRKVTIGCGIFTSIAAILTGAVSGIEQLLKDLHGLFALLSWIGGAVVCTLFGYLMLKNSKFSKSIIYSNFLVAGVFISYLFPFFTTNFCNLYREICYEVGQNIFIIMPIYEWTVIFSILFWYLINANYLFHKREILQLNKKNLTKLKSSD